MAFDSHSSPNPSRPIHYDPAVLRAELLDAVEELYNSVQGEAVRAAIGREALRSLREGQAAIRARLDGVLTLAVIGDFKRGKSTLINALVGTALVPTSATPETVTINEIHYGPTLRIEARLRDGGRVPLQPEELVSERLAPLLEPLEDRLSHVRIEAPVERLRDLTLVDTPGTGDVLHRFDERVQSYLARADAVLYVLSALSPLSETEQAFLRLSVAPQEFPRLFFVVNMMDVAESGSEAERLLGSVRGKLQRTFPLARLFGVSALDELGRVADRTRPNPARSAELEAGFAQLRRELDQLAAIHRDGIQLDRAAQEALALFQCLGQRLERLRNALESDSERLRRSIEACEDHQSELHRRVLERQNQVRDAIGAMGEQSVCWLDEFTDRWELEVLPVLPGHELDDLRRHFPFFLADTLRQAVNQCVQLHEPAVAALVREAEEAVRKDYRSLTGTDRAEAQVGRAAAASLFGELPWTMLDTVHMVVQLALGGVLTILMSFFKTHAVQAAHLEAFQARVREAIPALREAVRREVGQIYANLSREVEAHIEATYQQELEATLTALKQAQELAAQGGPRTAEVQAELGAAAAQIHAAAIRVSGIRDRASSPDATVGTG